MADTVTFYETYEKRDGVVYYKWRLEGDEDWHEKKTALKEVPYTISRTLPEEEWSLLYKEKLKGTKIYRHEQN